MNEIVKKLEAIYKDRHTSAFYRLKQNSVVKGLKNMRKLHRVSNFDSMVTNVSNETQTSAKDS